MRCGFFFHKGLYCFISLTGRAWGSPSNFPQPTLVRSCPDLCGLPKVSATADQSGSHHLARVKGREEILHPPEKDLAHLGPRQRDVSPATIPPASLCQTAGRRGGGGFTPGAVGFSCSAAKKIIMSSPGI